MKKQGYYIGIDLDDEYAVVSFLEPGLKEIQTVSMIAGSDMFQIPVLIAKRKGLGQWFVGIDAEQIAQKQQVTVIDCLLSRALREEKILIDDEYYYATDLLLLYIKKLMGYAGGISNNSDACKCAVTVSCLDKDKAKLLSGLLEQLGYGKEEQIILDRKASFYYFTFHQAKDLWLHDVMLFDYRQHEMLCMNLHRNRNAAPQYVTISEQYLKMDETKTRDEAFYELLSDCMRGHVISTIYLVGNGFDGNWMKQSLNYMCKGRRAFIGKNLYSKGSCYALVISEQIQDWPFVYLGDNEMKMDVCLKVKNHGIDELVPLLKIGDNCFEKEGSCEVIVSDTKNIPIWLKTMGSNQATVENLNLSDLPDRESKTTRLRITAKPLTDCKVQVMIKDLGFGEIVKSSNLNWEYIVSI